MKRHEARQQGLQKYNTGKACKNGHFSYRLTSNATCCECMFGAIRRYYLDNKAKILSQTSKYKFEHREELRNSTRESGYHKRRYQINRAYYIEKAIRRSKRVRQATPEWLTKSQIAELRSIYGNRPDGYHVDHIVPINGVNVCGLHVPWNLQYLPALDNIRKKNNL